MASYNLLTNVTLKAIREPGLHLDGRGLYVRVDQAGGRFWVLIFKFRGRRREMAWAPLSTSTSRRPGTVPMTRDDSFATASTPSRRGARNARL